MKIAICYEQTQPAEYRWRAYEETTYTGAPEDPVGFGRTPADALEDFLDRASAVMALPPGVRA